MSVLGLLVLDAAPNPPVDALLGVTVWDPGAATRVPTRVVSKQEPVSALGLTAASEAQGTGGSARKRGLGRTRAKRGQECHGGSARGTLLSYVAAQSRGSERRGGLRERERPRFAPTDRAGTCAAPHPRDGSATDLQRAPNMASYPGQGCLGL